jgi:hypothetical protein
MRQPTSGKRNKDVQPLTVERLREVLAYDPDTGVFIHKLSNPRTPEGSVAGWGSPNGYVRISVDDSKYLAHRLAWFHTYGQWPSGFIDHVNRDKSDNRIANLRQATKSQNSGNAIRRKDNKTGTRGVYWHKVANKFAAQLQINKKNITLGYFTTVEEAKAAYEAAAKEYFREFFHAGEAPL